MLIACLTRREGEHRWSCLSMLVDAALALAESDQADANRDESAKGFGKTCRRHVEVWLW